MTCAACAARVERVLTKNEHVLDASVSFPLKSAIVDIADDESFDFDEVIKSVNKIGYKAKEAAEDNTCLLYTSPSPRDYAASRMPSSA